MKKYILLIVIFLCGLYVPHQTFAQSDMKQLEIEFNQQFEKFDSNPELDKLKQIHQEQIGLLQKQIEELQKNKENHVSQASVNSVEMETNSIAQNSQNTEKETESILADALIIVLIIVFFVLLLLFVAIAADI